MLRKAVIIFVSAFILNMLWEHTHSVLYLHNRGGEITRLILTKAALFDAFIITFLAYYLKNIWYVVSAAFLFAIGLEWWALETGRWAYTAAMPIILGIGLSPIIQLPLLSYISLKISTWTK